jgi:hypothetical protein
LVSNPKKISVSSNLDIFRDSILKKTSSLYHKSEKTKVATMAIRVVEFSNWLYKIRKIFASESTYPKKIFEF